MNKRKILFWVVCVCLAMVFLLSGAMIWREESGRQKEKSEFEELAQMVGDSSTGRNLEKLFEQNPDCVGWLCIPGTQVNYPVMHTPDHPEKYLRRNFSGQAGQSGTPFLDARCSLDSTNLIIYGHNMRNHSMFGTLKHYLEEGYLFEHPVIELETASGRKEYTVFAVARMDSSDVWYRFTDTANAAQYEEYLAELYRKAVQISVFSPAYDQQLLTLSTCHDDQQERLLVVAAQ